MPEIGQFNVYPHESTTEREGWKKCKKDRPKNADRQKIPKNAEKSTNKKNEQNNQIKT